MTEAEKIFLVVSEELNLSKAAQRMFVSHQNISQHIQKLEDKYRTKLIVRKPKIQLTAAGRELADTLQQIQMLELQMQLRINEQDEHFCGELSIGMPYSRSFILAPLPQAIPQCESDLFGRKFRGIDSKAAEWVAGYVCRRTAQAKCQTGL